MTKPTHEYNKLGIIRNQNNETQDRFMHFFMRIFYRTLEKGFADLFTTLIIY